MVELNFIDSLKSALDRLETVTENIDKLTLEKDELRGKIRKWMDMHHLTEFESYNSTKTRLWQIEISKRKRQNVDKELLRANVPEDLYNQIITEAEFEFFQIKPVKKSKASKSSSSAPAAPKGTV